MEQDDYQELASSFLDCIEAKKETVPPYEMGYLMLKMAVDMLMSTCPEPEIGMETILHGVTDGFKEWRDRGV